jgi:hypothetical protein
MTGREFWERAAQWGSYMRAGDPGACLYGFDERGYVQSEDHRQACIRYLDGDCRAAAKLNEDPVSDNREIDALIEYLRCCPSLAPSNVKRFATTHI